MRTRAQQKLESERMLAERMGCSREKLRAVLRVLKLVETPSQRDGLISLGCDQLQGFLFAKAMRPEALGERIRSNVAAA